MYQMQFSVSVLLITTVDQMGKAKVFMQVSVSHVPCLNEVQLTCIPLQQTVTFPQSMHVYCRRVKPYIVLVGCSKVFC